MTTCFEFLARHIHRSRWPKGYGAISLILSGFGNACSGPYNDETVAVCRADETYILELSGQRVPLVHDPVSWILVGTIDAREQFRIPRNRGRIDGSEIDVDRGHYPYAGFIDISAEQVIVDLHYVRRDGEQRAVSWSGAYLLKPNSGG